MNRNTAQYGKENFQFVGKQFNGVVPSKPLLELPDDMRIRRKSTSGIVGQPLQATRKNCSKQCLNKLCLNEIQAILQQNPPGAEKPKSADYCLEKKFDFENSDNKIAKPANLIADKLSVQHKENPRTKLIFQQPRRDTKVKKRTGANYKYTGSYRDDFYNLEYLEDVMDIVRKDEIKLVVRGSCVDTKILDSKMRMEVVNWMLSLQSNFGFSEGEFYLAVNLLDQVLARECVPGNLYRLLILTTLWLSSKMFATRIFSSDMMIKYSCPSSYTPRELLKMEKRVLKILNYHIHTIEPTIITNYYLKLFNIENLELAIKSVYYILDCATLLAEYSRYPISIIGIAAISVAIKFYFPELEEKMNRYFMQKLSTDYMARKMCLESMLFSQIVKMRNKNYEFRQPYYKYKMNYLVRGLV